MNKLSFGKPDSQEIITIIDPDDESLPEITDSRFWKIKQSTEINIIIKTKSIESSYSSFKYVNKNSSISKIKIYIILLNIIN
jgi:hypothetical protein